jgi:hypothetical protein
MPFSITKNDEITDKCRVLAEKENRTVSNYIETLVKREYKKKGGDDD